MKKQIDFIYNLLKVTYAVVPVVAGLDKFTNLLTDWGHYLSPWQAAMLPFDGSIFFKIIGVIEILAGILVFLQTRTGAFIVSVWLLLIALVLFSGGNNFDVAVRDIVMAAGALSLFKLCDLNMPQNTI